MRKAALCSHVWCISACPPSDRQPSYRRSEERRSALALGQAHIDRTVCHAADTFLLCHCRHLSLPPPLPPNQKFKKLEPNGPLADARESKCKQCTLGSVRVDNVSSSYQWRGGGTQSWSSRLGVCTVPHKSDSLWSTGESPWRRLCCTRVWTEPAGRTGWAVGLTQAQSTWINVWLPWIQCFFEAETFYLQSLKKQFSSLPHQIIYLIWLGPLSYRCAD